MKDTCDKCGKEVHHNFAWTISSRGGEETFCSRRCLVEKVAPELKHAVVVGQWIPTPEDEARMSE
jgi:hypothetical protein